jgi:hypothetical protein
MSLSLHTIVTSTGQFDLVSNNKRFMVESRSLWPGLPEVPGDLRSWLPEPAFLQRVFESVEEVQNLSAMRPFGTLAAGRPRVFLTTLTYAYGAGVLPSDEIELRIRTDPQLRYLSARTSPAAQELRKFRREHRVWVEQAVQRLIRRAWEAHTPETDVSGDFGGPDLEAYFADAASERINRAVLLDSMALDV